MRCPDCNKFVSYDEPQCENQSVELDDNTVRATVTVQLNCQDCGTTLKDCEIESEVEFEHECKPDAEQSPDFIEGEEQFEIENEGDPQGTSRMVDKDRNGKPIKSARYMKTMYGFEMESEIKCRKCGEVFSVNSEGEEQASAFNECV